MEEAEGMKKSAALMGLTPLSVIKIKRNNERPHTAEEIKWFVHSFAAAEGAMSNQQQPVRDYQMAAWLMAICLNGMTSEETAALTHAMVHSGVVLPSLASKHVTADKHSTGGVGDKISLLLAPLVASCGVWVPMMAGRGLEHTGGTIDKLESLNMKTTFSVPEFHRLVQTVGCCIASPSQDMCPADRKMYALRDVTGTVVSLPLQTASIMSKKIAENPDTLVLDVKYGIAAFQPNLDAAISLAKSMIAAGEGCGKTTTAFLTRMDHPLGNAVGNWIEVKECVDIMTDPEPFMVANHHVLQLVLVQAAQMLVQSNIVKNLKDGMFLARTKLMDGSALAKFREMVVAQGGDPTYIDSPNDYPPASFSAKVMAKSSGIVVDINALVVGQASVWIGAGRRVSDEPVDATAGIWMEVQVGSRVQTNQLVATIFSERRDTLEYATQLVEQAICILESNDNDDDVNHDAAPPLISHFVTKHGVEPFSMSILDE